MTATRIAATDVGSNTVHLLVGEVHGDAVREVHREVLMPRLGAVVGATGRIGAEKIASVAADLRRLAAAAHEHGATVLLLCATEAVRRAADREDALRAFGEAYGAPCRLIPGEVEARLSFRGASSVLATHAPLLVCDIGGGSTEFAFGRHGNATQVESLPIGSGAATDRWLHHDPPSGEERRACFGGVIEALRGARAGDPPEHIVATGGTASTLPVLLDRDHETHLDAGDLARCRAILGRHPSEEIAARHGLDPARARVLAGGVEIVDAVRVLFDAERIRVTIHGLRSGMILACAQNGDRWIEG
jgi:exopolyphosphatase / guanosine-5'-triphosphate,3'-diphosphate pyrophosphatase